ncbi:MAG: hypothetical protein EP343_29705 [Deltaproteobacteria bacterium]|nr:MAG: hypothetical protein EP343_29705 [Deltaproteobacteria bacterium]
MLVETRMSRLQALATGLCLDIGINLELSESSWAYDPLRRTILISQDDLQKRGPEFCAGILAHEVGHYFISRYNLFKVDFPSLPALQFLLNGIEDPRVNTWISRRYPGVQSWIDLANRDSIGEWRETDQRPAFVAFCFACAGEYAFNWTPMPKSMPMPPRVREALDETRDARRRYALTLPPAQVSTDSFDPRVVVQFQRFVAPRMQMSSRLLSLPRREQGICVNAMEALMLAEEEILPVAKTLLDDDLQRLDQLMRNNPEKARQTKKALEQEDLPMLSKAIQESLSQELNEERRTPPESPLALRVFDGWLRQKRRETQPLISAREAALHPLPTDQRSPRRRTPGRFRPRPNRRVTLPPPTENYDIALQKVSQQIDHLTRTFEQLLRPRQRLGKRSGYATGQIVDLRQLMAFEADPRRYNKLWTRKTVPERKVTAITLLIDLSGSMEGEKAEAALCGTVLLAETLSRIKVPFSVLGFQDEVLPFHNFGEPMSPYVRQKIGEMPMEVSGNRPHGHNCPEYNDDGPCLREAADFLLEQSAYERILIAVSDGYPEGRRSSPQDLTNTIRELSKEPINLIGVGLGPDTQHVKEFYPQSIAEVPVNQFADKLGDLLRKSLTHT